MRDGHKYKSSLKEVKRQTSCRNLEEAKIIPQIRVVWLEGRDWGKLQ